jgi:hypothetical protein
MISQEKIVIKEECCVLLIYGNPLINGFVLNKVHFVS